MSLNEKFITRLFDEMVKKKTSLSKYLNDDDNDMFGETTDFRELASVITKEFPWPVGIELRRLLSGGLEELNRGRLDQLIKTYERIMQYLSFIMVINLYEEKVKSGIDIPDGFKREFDKRFRVLSLGDYIWAIRSISNIFKNNKIKYFVDEMNELFTISFLKKTSFLLQERNDLSHYLVNITQDDIEIKCVEFMEKLCDLLVDLAFLIKYPLVTIPEITVKKHRNSVGLFAHQMLILNSTSSNFFGLTRDFSSFTESPSVLLIKSAKDIPM